MWQYHDKKLIELKRLYNRTNKQTQNKLQELIDTFDFTNENIYNIATTKDKKRINNYIEEWKDNGLLNGYFGILADSIYKRKNVKNSEILELLIYSAYIEEQSKLEEKEQQIFKEDVEYYYNEGINEVRKAQGKQNKYSVIPDAIFLALLDEINSMGYTWKQQVEIMARNNANQLYRQVVVNLMQQKPVEINSREYLKTLDNQIKQKININGNKISGATDLELLCLNNKAKIKGIEAEDDNAKVVFLADLDGKETPMCHSLHRQEFYINKENKFDRYYGDNPKELSIQRIKCKGLVAGLNLPPINHHFHWCRSIIQYVIPVEKSDKKEYNIDNFLYIEQHDKTKHTNYEEDYIMAAKEYQQIPENVRKMLYDNGVRFKFDYNRKTSGYNRNTKEILLKPNLVEGELTHEIGHAIYYNMNVKNMKEYQDLVNDIFNNTHRPPIEIKNRNIDFYALDTDYKVNDEFQVYLGESSRVSQIIDNINNRNLPELFSEAYRCYYSKNERHAQSDSINKLVEEVEKRC